MSRASLSDLHSLILADCAGEEVDFAIHDAMMELGFAVIWEEHQVCFRHAGNAGLGWCWLKSAAERGLQALADELERLAVMKPYA
jgi:hypothetical protein